MPERDKVASKIYKLLALGESSNKSESESAIAKAHELMAKYNITLLDLPQDRRVYTSRPVGSIYNKVPSYINRLGRIVHDYYFVKYIFMPYKYSYGRGPGTQAL